ncbi:hypothetical protein Tco_1053836 [Tanacetum coccineum]|uniref:Uncharacterized protein n=1 Tax=Tanacetum coccineum TaxID=301880 RepID=A0ABQ5GVH5_9ASTR
MGVEDNDGENDDAEVYNPYKEADPLNRPPSSPETAKREIMNAPITWSTLQPIPPIRVKPLTKQMWDRFRVESSSSRRLERIDMRMDSFDDDLIALDSTFREQMDNAVRADAAGDHDGESVDTTAIVKDVGEEKDDEGDNVAAAKDSQYLESYGSPCDP